MAKLSKKCECGGSLEFKGILQVGKQHSATFKCKRCEAEVAIAGIMVIARPSPPSPHTPFHKFLDRKRNPETGQKAYK